MRQTLAEFHEQLGSLDLLSAEEPKLKQDF